MRELVYVSDARAPSWFADTDIRPDAWMHFEAPMAYRVISFQRGEALVFVDADAATPEYPTGGRLRLLLHGSAHHLLETHQVPIATPASDSAAHGGTNSRR